MNNKRAIVVTGANQGQGFALCQRILKEHDDTHVFLCSRDLSKGQAAVEKLVSDDKSQAGTAIITKDRVQAICLDVTDAASVQAAASQIQTLLQGNKLYGCVSNAGILWGYSLQEQFQVNARGVRTVLDTFLPLMKSDDDGINTGRMIVVSSGLGPLMHSYASDINQRVLNKGDLEWDDLEVLMQKCLQVKKEQGPAGFEEIGFPGGPFAEAAPDFHVSDELCTIACLNVEQCPSSSCLLAFSPTCISFLDRCMVWPKCLPTPIWHRWVRSTPTF
jgi:short chain dehydrogenase